MYHSKAKDVNSEKEIPKTSVLLLLLLLLHSLDFLNPPSTRLIHLKETYSARSEKTTNSRMNAVDLRNVVFVDLVSFFLLRLEIGFRSMTGEQMDWWMS